MDIVRLWRGVPAELKGAALAIGNFDGVHRGHQEVLRAAIDIAKSEGCRSGAVVFEPHPREFFAPDTPFFRLTPLPLKLELLAALGLDQTFVIPFDRELASLSAEAFATEVVAKGLGASHVVVGHDFSYGKGRTGTTEELAELGRVLGFGVDIVAPVGADGTTFSSSRIRDHLRNGEVRRRGRASSAIGGGCAAKSARGPGAARNSASPRSTSSSRRARTCATASTPCASTITERAIRLPAMSARAHLRRGRAGARGLSPRLPGDLYGTEVEAELIAFLRPDIAGDLYGQEVEAEFIEFLRPDQTFAAPAALAAQMSEDCDRARAVLTKIDADDPMRRFPLARALAKPAPST